MTNKDYAEILKGLVVPIHAEAAMDRAIDLLEQESVIDKIKAEIERMDYLDIEDGSDGYDNYVDRYDVLQIIDKYKRNGGKE